MFSIPNEYKLYCDYKRGVLDARGALWGMWLRSQSPLVRIIHAKAITRARAESADERLKPILRHAYARLRTLEYRANSGERLVVVNV